MNIEFSSTIFMYVIHYSLAHNAKIDSHKDNVQLERKIELFDADANLLHEQFKDAGIAPEDLMQIANQHGVTKFFVPGSTLKSSDEVLKLKTLYPGAVMVSCGVHPYHAAADIFSDSSYQVLEEMIRNPDCSAVGECGLDYSEGFPDGLTQKAWFRAHLEIACRLQKPLFMHSRAAKVDFADMLHEFGFSSQRSPPVPGLVHCFTEECDELSAYLDMGLYIGLTGFVINNPVKLQQYAKLVPLDRLLVETDAPYLGFPGCRESETKKRSAKYPNVPASLPKVVSAIAEAKGVSFSVVAEATTRNALRLFRIAK